MPITLEDIPEFEGECLRLEVVYRGRARMDLAGTAEDKAAIERNIHTGMFYFRDRRDAGMIPPAIIVYEHIENGEYKDPKVIYLDDIEEISPVSLDRVIRNPGSPLSEGEKQYLQEIKDSIPPGQASPL